LNGAFVRGGEKQCITGKSKIIQIIVKIGSFFPVLQEGNKILGRYFIKICQKDGFTRSNKPFRVNFFTRGGIQFYNRTALRNISETAGSPKLKICAKIVFKRKETKKGEQIVPPDRPLLVI
jgi:hypothetical protein